MQILGKMFEEKPIMILSGDCLKEPEFWLKKSMFHVHDLNS